jgi:hypothetical protein
MKEELRIENSLPKLTSEGLTALLRHPTTEVLKSDGEISKILINGYIIEDEYIILDERIQLSITLTFQNCTFKSKNIIFIDGMICMKS